MQENDPKRSIPWVYQLGPTRWCHFGYPWLPPVEAPSQLEAAHIFTSAIEELSRSRHKKEGTRFLKAHPDAKQALLFGQKGQAGFADAPPGLPGKPGDNLPPKAVLDMVDALIAMHPNRVDPKDSSTWFGVNDGTVDLKPTTPADGHALREKARQERADKARSKTPPPTRTAKNHAKPNRTHNRRSSDPAVWGQDAALKADIKSWAVKSPDLSKMTADTVHDAIDALGIKLIRPKGQPFDQTTGQAYNKISVDQLPSSSGTIPSHLQGDDVPGKGKEKVIDTTPVSGAGTQPTPTLPAAGAAVNGIIPGSNWLTGLDPNKKPVVPFTGWTYTPVSDVKLSDYIWPGAPATATPDQILAAVARGDAVKRSSPSSSGSTSSASSSPTTSGGSPSGNGHPFNMPNAPTNDPSTDPDYILQKRFDDLCNGSGSGGSSSGSGGTTPSPPPPNPPPPGQHPNDDRAPRINQFRLRPIHMARNASDEEVECVQNHLPGFQILTDLPACHHTHRCAAAVRNGLVQFQLAYGTYNAKRTDDPDFKVVDIGGKPRYTRDLPYVHVTTPIIDDRDAMRRASFKDEDKERVCKCKLPDMCDRCQHADVYTMTDVIYYLEPSDIAALCHSVPVRNFQDGLLVDAPIVLSAHQTFDGTRGSHYKIENSPPESRWIRNGSNVECWHESRTDSYFHSACDWLRKGHMHTANGTIAWQPISMYQGIEVLRFYAVDPTVPHRDAAPNIEYSDTYYGDVDMRGLLGQGVQPFVNHTGVASLESIRCYSTGRYFQFTIDDRKALVPKDIIDAIAARCVNRSRNAELSVTMTDYARTLYPKTNFTRAEVAASLPLAVALGMTKGLKSEIAALQHTQRAAREAERQRDALAQPWTLGWVLWTMDRVRDTHEFIQRHPYCALAVCAATAATGAYMVGKMRGIHINIPALPAAPDIGGMVAAVRRPTPPPSLLQRAINYFRPPTPWYRRAGNAVMSIVRAAPTRTSRLAQISGEVQFIPDASVWQALGRVFRRAVPQFDPTYNYYPPVYETWCPGPPGNSDRIYDGVDYEEIMRPNAKLNLRQISPSDPCRRSVGPIPTGIGFKQVEPVLVNVCHHSALHALLWRALRDRNDPVDGFWDLVDKTLGEWPNLPDVQPTPIKDWLARFPPGKRKRLIAAMPYLADILNFHRTVAHSMFVKRECVIKRTTGVDATGAPIIEPFAPRAIQACDPVNTLIIGPWAHAFSKAMGQRECDGTPGRRVQYAPGMNAEAHDLWLHRAKMILEGPFAYIDLDCKRLDASVRGPANDFANTVFAKCGCSDKALRLLEANHVTHGHTRDGIKYEVDDTVGSGQATTTCGNSTMCGGLMEFSGGGFCPAHLEEFLANKPELAAISHIFRDEIRFFALVAGDDGAVVCLAEDAERLAARFSLAYWAAGFEATININYHSYDMEFCSARWWPANNEYGHAFGPKPGKLLPKLFFAVDRATCSRNPNRYARAIAEATLPHVNHLPYAREVMLTVLRLTSGVTKLQIKREEHKATRTRIAEQSPEIWDAYYHIYGLDRPAVEAAIARLQRVRRLPVNIDEPIMLLFNAADAPPIGDPPSRSPTRPLQLHRNQPRTTRADELYKDWVDHRRQVDGPNPYSACLPHWIRRLFAPPEPTCDCPSCSDPERAALNIAEVWSYAYIEDALKAAAPQAGCAIWALERVCHTLLGNKHPAAVYVPQYHLMYPALGIGPVGAYALSFAHTAWNLWAASRGACVTVPPASSKDALHGLVFNTTKTSGPNAKCPLKSSFDRRSRPGESVDRPRRSSRNLNRRSVLRIVRDGLAGDATRPSEPEPTATSSSASCLATLSNLHSETSQDPPNKHERGDTSSPTISPRTLCNPIQEPHLSTSQCGTHLSTSPCPTRTQLASPLTQETAWPDTLHTHPCQSPFSTGTINCWAQPLRSVAPLPSSTRCMGCPLSISPQLTHSTPIEDLCSATAGATTKGRSSTPTKRTRRRGRPSASKTWTVITPTEFHSTTEMPPLISSSPSSSQPRPPSPPEHSSATSSYLPPEPQPRSSLKHPQPDRPPSPKLSLSLAESLLLGDAMDAVCPTNPSDIESVSTPTASPSQSQLSKSPIPSPPCPTWAAWHHISLKATTLPFVSRTSMPATQLTSGPSSLDPTSTTEVRWLPSSSPEGTPFIQTDWLAMIPALTPTLETTWELSRWGLGTGGSRQLLNTWTFECQERIPCSAMDSPQSALGTESPPTPNLVYYSLGPDGSSKP